MNKFQEKLAAVSADLGVVVIFDFEVTLPSGARIVSPAYFPTFGAQRGTLLFDWSAPLNNVGNEIKGEGYTFSIMSVSDDRQDRDYQEELNVWAEVLADWSWTGTDGGKPAWLDAIAASRDDKDTD
jgi:hypothetical protein